MISKLRTCPTESGSSTFAFYPSRMFNLSLDMSTRKYTLYVLLAEYDIVLLYRFLFTHFLWDESFKFSSLFHDFRNGMSV